jgi:hypothetical protein
VNTLKSFEKNAINVTLTDEELDAFLPQVYLSIGLDSMLRGDKLRRVEEEEKHAPEVKTENM